MKNLKFNLYLTIIFTCLFIFNVYGAALDSDSFDNLKEDFNNIKTIEDIKKQKFHIYDNHSFNNIEFENFGTVKFIICEYNKYGKMAIFLADSNDNIIYKTLDFEANDWYLYSLEAVSFRDADTDGLKDIIIISKNTSGSSTNPFIIADILFQNKDSFNKNDEITKKINQYSMNKNVDMVLSYTRGKSSKEFLYNSSNIQQLKDNNNFNMIDEQSFDIDFESLGEMKVISAVYEMDGFNDVLLYITNQQGDILQVFNPMPHYDNFINVRGISFADINSDGLKDIIFLANYSNYINKITFSSCNIYFQNEKYFYSNDIFDEMLAVSSSDALQDIIDKSKKIFKDNFSY